MAYEVFARKWRPQIFEDVLGQEHVTRTLLNAIAADRLHHAYLFSGARGVGKTSVARILAKAINCKHRVEGNPCNKCESCMDISSGSAMDVQEIDGASNRGIDEIRELRENIKHMPSSGRYRVYIIDEVHMLTLQAFNALLKTLEEPPPHVKFIFATTEPHKVPITILSRCQRYDFKRIPQARLVEQLEKITAEEKVEISRQGLALIAREADGGMRDAVSLLDQVISFSGTKIANENIADILGIIDSELVFKAADAIIDGRSGECIEIVNSLYHYGYDIKEFYKALMDHYRNLLISLVAADKNLLDVTEETIKELQLQAKKAGVEKLQQSLNILIIKEEAFRFTSHARLVLETIMIKLSRLGELLSIGDLISKLEAMEKLIGKGAEPTSYNNKKPEQLISEPEPRWQKSTPATVTPTANTSSESKGWEGLLSYVSARNKGMFAVLKECRLIEIKDKTLEIERGNSPFATRYLNDPESIEKLNSFLKEYFEKDVKVTIKLPAELPAAPAPAPVAKEPDIPKSVKEVLSVFKGELK
ncbi:MAG: DNA polymerase III subunit gamma/tau [Deltaproteobacteria bacterium]|nr:DNA polymerase III subunit gamma/tau [Deltaproteobacteria bacterium]